MGSVYKMVSVIVVGFSVVIIFIGFVGKAHGALLNQIFSEQSPRETAFIEAKILSVQKDVEIRVERIVMQHLFATIQNNNFRVGEVLRVPNIHFVPGARVLLSIDRF